MEVSAFTIDRRIVRKEIGKEMNKILKTELEATLTASCVPMPRWVVERVQDMSSTWYPFVKAPPLKKQLGSETETKSIGYLVNPSTESLDDAAERLQDFYLCLEQDMRVGGVLVSKWRGESLDGEHEKERDEGEHEMMESETRVRDIMEAVERTITSLFYDRFVPLCGAFDEALMFSTDYSCNLQLMMHPTMRHCQVVLQHLTYWIWVLGILALK